MIGDKDDFQTEEEMFEALRSLDKRMTGIENRLIEELKNDK